MSGDLQGGPEHFLPANGIFVSTRADSGIRKQWTIAQSRYAYDSAWMAWMRQFISVPDGLHFLRVVDGIGETRRVSRSNRSVTYQVGVDTLLTARKEGVLQEKLLWIVHQILVASATEENAWALPPGPLPTSSPLPAGVERDIMRSMTI